MLEDVWRYKGGVDYKRRSVSLEMMRCKPQITMFFKGGLLHSIIEPNQTLSPLRQVLVSIRLMFTRKLWLTTRTMSLAFRLEQIRGCYTSKHHRIHSTYPLDSTFKLLTHFRPPVFDEAAKLKIVLKDYLGNYRGDFSMSHRF